MSDISDILNGDPSQPPQRRRARETPPRKKACESCALGKVRCDQKRPCCTRCDTRRLTCIYVVPATPVQITQSPLQTEGFRAHKPSFQTTYSSPATVNNDSNFASSSISPFNIAPARHLEPRNTTNRIGGQRHNQYRQSAYWSGSPVDFSNLNLISNLDATKIQDRWLGGFCPSFNDKAKEHPPSLIDFVARVFKTYPNMMLQKGRLPPYIHPSQLAGTDIPTPLANCLSLVRLWDGQVRGGEAFVQDVVKKEMDRLYVQRHTYEPMDLLAAFQSYLTYAMMAYFSSDGVSLVDRQVIINLQDFGCDISSRGLVCPGELSHTRPDWESWIVASTKRRCLYTMYLFDNVFCTQHNLPTFLGEELESLPVPASKALWEISCRDQWEREYNSFLGVWDGSGLTIDELWPAPPGRIEVRRKRVERWLESVDEFGMMLFAVTSVTHGT